MLRLGLFFLAIVLTGCAYERARMAANAQITMIGMPKDRVLACMGPPINRASEGAVEVWSYNSGNGFRTYDEGISVGRSCTVNLTFTNDAISAINYLGPTGGLLTPGEQCAFAIQQCLPPKG